MTQDIDNKDMAKMIIYLMDRHFPCRNLDALVEALEMAMEMSVAGSKHEYYYDWKYLKGVFWEVQKEDIHKSVMERLDKLEESTSDEF